MELTKWVGETYSCSAGHLEVSGRMYGDLLERVYADSGPFAIDHHPPAIMYMEVPVWRKQGDKKSGTHLCH
jgi:hypothetical protein